MARVLLDLFKELVMKKKRYYQRELRAACVCASASTYNNSVGSFAFNTLFPALLIEYEKK